MAKNKINKEGLDDLGNRLNSLAQPKADSECSALFKEADRKLRDLKKFLIKASSANNIKDEFKTKVEELANATVKAFKANLKCVSKERKASVDILSEERGDPVGSSLKELVVDPKNNNNNKITVLTNKDKKWKIVMDFN